MSARPFSENCGVFLFFELRVPNRIEDAASSSGRGRRHGGRHHKFRECNGVAERERRTPNQLDDHISNAEAESGFDEGAREEERADDELDRAVAEAHQRALRLQNAAEGA